LKAPTIENWPDASRASCRRNERFNHVLVDEPLLEPDVPVAIVAPVRAVVVEPEHFDVELRSRK
jgi:hypothetical protein